MSFFSRLNVSTRLALGFCSIALIGIGIALYSIVRLQALTADMQLIAKDRMVKVAMFTDVLDNLNTNAQGVRNMVISDDPALREAEKKTAPKSRRPMPSC